MIFDYSRKDLSFQALPLGENRERKAYYLSFPSPLKSDFPENNTVWCTCFEPHNREKFPAIIIIPSWGEREGGGSEQIARRLIGGGWGTYIIHLPYHMRRTPRGAKSGAYFLTPDISRSTEAFRQAVIDIRALVDFLTHHQRVEKGRIGILGRSLGAIILHTAMGVEDRLKAGVSILGGGDLNQIVAKGIATFPLFIYGFFHGLRIRHYRNVSRQFDCFLQEVWRKKDVDKIHPPWVWFLLDPLTYAYRNKPRRVLMINGIFDLVIPRSAVIKLWLALDKPPIIWFPTSHFTARIFWKPILNRSIEYLRRSL